MNEFELQEYYARVGRYAQLHDIRVDAAIRGPIFRLPKEVAETILREVKERTPWSQTALPELM